MIPNSYSLAMSFDFAILPQLFFVPMYALLEVVDEVPEHSPFLFLSASLLV